MKRSIADMQKAALSRGGQCLSAIYEGMESKLEWQCHSQHKWETKPSTVIYKENASGGSGFVNTEALDEWLKSEPV